MLAEVAVRLLRSLVVVVMAVLREKRFGKRCELEKATEIGAEKKKKKKKKKCKP